MNSPRNSHRSSHVFDKTPLVLRYHRDTEAHFGGRTTAFFFVYLCLHGIVGNKSMSSEVPDFAQSDEGVSGYYDRCFISSQ